MRRQKKATRYYLWCTRGRTEAREKEELQKINLNLKLVDEKRKENTSADKPRNPSQELKKGSMINSSQGFLTLLQIFFLHLFLFLLRFCVVFFSCTNSLSRRPSIHAYIYTKSKQKRRDCMKRSIHR